MCKLVQLVSCLEQTIPWKPNSLGVIYQTPHSEASGFSTYLHRSKGRLWKYLKLPCSPPLLSCKSPVPVITDNLSLDVAESASWMLVPHGEGHFS